MRNRTSTRSFQRGTPYGWTIPYECECTTVAEAATVRGNRRNHMITLTQGMNAMTPRALVNTILDEENQRVTRTHKPYPPILYPSGASRQDKRIIREKVSLARFQEREALKTARRLAAALAHPARVVKNCDHRVYEWSGTTSGEVGRIIQTEYFENPYARTDSERACLADWYAPHTGDGALDWCIGYLPPPTPSELPVDPAWLNRAVRESHKAIQPDLDLAAELYQVKDLRAAIRSVSQVLVAWKREVPEAIQKMKGTRSRKEAIKYLTKDLVGAHLAYKWGLLPTYEACVAVSRLVAKVQQDFTRFAERCRKGSQIYRSGFPLEISPASETRTSGHYSVTRVDTISLRYGYSVVQQLVPTVGYLNLREYINARTGLDRPLNTIWELVPYSFVVDYFLDVDRVLDELQDMYSVFQVALKDPCLTKKFRWTSQYNLQVTGSFNFWVYPYPVIWTASKTFDCGSITQSHFVRSREELQPHFLEETWKKRLFTMSELIYQRVIR